MRKNTEDGLMSLAEILANEYNVEDLTHSTDFINVAVHEVEENEIPLSKELVVKYENELVRMINNKVDGLKSLEEDEIWQQMLNDDDEDFVFENDRRIVATIHFYSDGTFEKVTPKTSPKPRYKDYTMFAEGEDGLIILKGKYKGKSPSEINELAGFETAAAGWAKWMLDSDQNLTEDDREALKKIMQNIL